MATFLVQRKMDAYAFISCNSVIYIQTWKWKQGGGAICWLWWIPATSSRNRAQWPHTGEWWWRTISWLHCSSKAFPPILFFLFCKCLTLNVYPATLPILVSRSHHSITALYSLSHDPSNISSLTHRYFPFIFSYIPFKEFSGWWLSVMVICSNFLPFIISISFSFLIWSLLTVTLHFSGILSYQPKFTCTTLYEVLYFGCMYWWCSIRFQNLVCDACKAYL